VSRWRGAVGVEKGAQDLALFHRVMLDAVQAVTTEPPKVAFLFLTNSDLTFVPLWQRFFAGHADRFNVYVHADPSMRMLLPTMPSFRGRFMATWPTRRGDLSLIAAARRLLDDAANAYLALLSQHCHHP
jgi:hypothetical protein